MPRDTATVRYSVYDGMTARERLLWIAQDGRCGLCLQRLSPYMARSGALAGANPTNLEHVWPRKLRNDLYVAAVSAGRPMFDGTVGNSVLAHADCNCAKGNRAPTGCELIVLHLVNAITGERPKVRRWRTGRRE